MQDVFNQLDWTRRVKHHAGSLAEVADLREHTVQMDRRGRLRGDQQMIGSGLDKCTEIALRLNDHQVHIKRLLRAASHRFDNHRAERNIRHEAAVHYVNVDPVGASQIDGTNLVGEMCEIRRQNRRRNNNWP
jgi:hypothetical protein